VHPLLRYCASEFCYLSIGLVWFFEGELAQFRLPQARISSNLYALTFLLCPVFAFFYRYYDGKPGFSGKDIICIKLGIFIDIRLSSRVFMSLLQG
jgi:hypothetical protein